MLYDLAKEFFLRLNGMKSAVIWLAAYDMRIEFDTIEGEAFHVNIKRGRVNSVGKGKLPDFNIRDDISIFGEEKYFTQIFEGHVSPATAMFFGKVTPRGERAKHNQAVVAFRLMRIAQEPEMISKLE